MPVGLQVFSAGGALVFDTTAVEGGCVIDIVTSTASSQVKNYTAFPGKSVFLLLVSGYAFTTATISYASGYPSVTFPPSFSGTYEWVVFVY